MTEPDWTDVTPRPVGYVSPRSLEYLKKGGWSVALHDDQRPDDVPLYERPIPQQQPEPNQWGAGYQDCREFVVQRLCSQLPPADAINALDALGWPTDDESLRAVGVMR